MANYTNPKIKFGVVHTSPASLITNAASLEDGKLYFAAGEASGLVKQGIYGVVGVTTDGSIDIDGSGNGKQLAMFGTGAVADGTGYGLSQCNFDSDASTKLKNLHDASANYLLKTSYVQVNKDSSGYVPKADGSAGTIDSSTTDWVLTFDGTKVDWYKLPENAFKNDNSIYTGTSPINVSGTTISHAESDVTAGRYGDVDNSTGRILEFGGKFKVVDISVNALGHVTGAISRELTLPSKPDTAGTADVANKVSKTFDISVNSSDKITYDGSVNKTLAIKGSNNIDVSSSVSNNILTITIDTSGVPTTADMNDAISTALTSALKYKGTVDGSASKLPQNHVAGDVYVASASFETTTAETGKAYKVESGDYFISNGTIFNVVNGENQVDNKAASISANGTEHDVSIATVDGTDITIKVPAAYYIHPFAGDSSIDTPSTTTTATTLLTRVKIDASGHVTDTSAFTGTVGGTTTPVYFNAGVPTALSYTIAKSVPENAVFTDEKVKANTSTGQIYLVGQDDSSDGTTESVYKNASVYMQAGKMYATSGSVVSNDAALVTGGTVYTAVEAATIYWETL